MYQKLYLLIHFASTKLANSIIISLHSEAHDIAQGEKLSLKMGDRSSFKICAHVPIVLLKKTRILIGLGTF